jgi:UDP-2,3-diacylglucosamine pyrophosphatase LpxH
MHYDTLLVSDVHLGCAVSLAADLLHLLQNTTFKRLILLGDIFQDLNFSRLTTHWERLDIGVKIRPNTGVPCAHKLSY